MATLAVSDLMAGLVGGLFSTFSNAEGRFPFEKFWCMLEGFSVSFFGEVILT